MRYTSSDKLIAWLTLFSGLTVSAVAIYYSVAGLVAIFAAAAIPIIIMGVALEASKLVATVWLKWNWQRAPLAIKSYLIAAISILMIITSMGIFGYLSKAHLDQAVPTGDVAAKVELIDEKIKTQRDNIATARAALQQMDNQVNERLSRSADDKGAERAVQIRRQQQTERAKLQKEISEAQATIAKLNEERAPIASELRKVEAEVGPIKYIAALIYGDTADATLLEAAVRWVIIIIVIVFDPLAVILLLASQYSFQWFRQEKEEQPQEQKQKEEEPTEPEEMASDVYEMENVKSDPPAGNSFWPFPTAVGKKPEEKEDDFKFLADDKDLYPEGKDWEKDNKEEKIEDTLPEAEVRHNEDTDQDDNEMIESAELSEKQAMSKWKAENPNSSLKLQKRLLERGVIKKLPWEIYLEPKPDYVEDDAAIEALKWAQEKIDQGYVQNQEQNSSTIWQKVKQAKEKDDR